MSDDRTFQRQQQDLVRRIGQSEVKETPPLYLPWSQRAFNPFPLASSGGFWGDVPQPWANAPLVFTCSVDVLTTNNNTNYWTIELFSLTTAAALNLVASFDTKLLTANAPSRLADPTVVTPGATDVSYALKLTATLSPGSIFVFPALALLRTGN